MLVNPVIKICKIREVHSARTAAVFGAKFLGLHAIENLSDEQGKVFAEIQIELDRYFPWCKAVLLTKIPNPEKVADMLRRTGITYVQPHLPFKYDELLSFASAVWKHGISCRFLPVIASSHEELLPLVSSYVNRPWQRWIEFFVIDSSWRGGTGEPGDDSRIGAILRLLPRDRCLLAGGISSDNAAYLMSRHSVAGFDLQSSVECEHIKSKDPIKLKVFARALGITPLQSKKPFISFAPEAAESACREGAIKRAAVSGIDIIHFDHSDASQVADFRIDSTEGARSLWNIAPCLPYDLHLFVDKSRVSTIIRHYCAGNPNLRAVHISINEWEAGLPTFGFEEDISCEIVVAIRPNQRTALENLLPVIKNLNLVTESKSHYDPEFELEMASLISFENGRGANSELIVDRRITTEKVKRFAEIASVNHAVVGKEFLRRDPTELLRDIRMQLKSRQ